MARYDIAIIGTGPAGISAAITATIRNKKILLIGQKDLSEKIKKAHSINNYPGIPNASGEDLQKAFSDHLDQLEIEITEDRVSAVYSMGQYFVIQGNGVVYEADTVILATGVHFGKPYPGETEYLGRGVSYCATCDAPLYKGKTVAIIGSSKKEEEEVNFMSEICAKVYYFPLYKDEVVVDNSVEIVHDYPEAITGAMKADVLHTKEGKEYNVDGIFILRDSVSPGQLVPGLKIDDNLVEVNRKMETNIKGCYACGDLTGTPYQYVKAAGEGNVAALSAVSYLAEKKKMESNQE